MISNLERYKKDLDALVDRGTMLYVAMKSEFVGEGFDSA